MTNSAQPQTPSETTPGVKTEAMRRALRLKAILCIVAGVLLAAIPYVGPVFFIIGVGFGLFFLFKEKRGWPRGQSSNQVLPLEKFAYKGELDVVGESFYTGNIARVWKAVGDDTDVVGYLVPEPKNAHDKNAVAVCLTAAPLFGFMTVGYLPRELAIAVAPSLAGHKARGTRAMVTGQVHAFKANEGHQLYSVRIG